MLVKEAGQQALRAGDRCFPKIDKVHPQINL